MKISLENYRFKFSINSKRFD